MKKIRFYSKKYPKLFTIADHEEGAIEEIIEAVKLHEFDFIIELGTRLGAVTLALHEAFPDKEIYSFDNGNHFCNLDISGKLNITFPDLDLMQFRKTCFDDNVAFIHANLIHVHKEYEERGFIGYSFLHWLAARPESKFMYCDNGSKAFEIAHYGGNLNPGDIMGVHDWGKQVNRERALTYTKKGIEDFVDMEDFNKMAEKKRWTSRLFLKLR
jgi:hypothetical protein